jgi:hypothetical protein
VFDPLQRPELPLVHLYPSGPLLRQVRLLDSYPDRGHSDRGHPDPEPEDHLLDGPLDAPPEDDGPVAGPAKVLLVVDVGHIEFLPVKVSQIVDTDLGQLLPGTGLGLADGGRPVLKGSLLVVGDLRRGEKGVGLTQGQVVPSV